MISFKEYRAAQKLIRESDKQFEIMNGKDSHLHQGVSNFKNWEFDPQLHGPSQAKERRPDMSHDDWNDLLTRSHEAITNPAKHVVPHGKQPTKVKTGDALFYSLSKQQGVVLRVVHKNPDNPKLGGKTRLETILPKSKSFPKEGTQRIVIEGNIFTEGENLILIE